MNRGTGAGGAKTNHNGKKFEDKTDNEMFESITQYVEDLDKNNYFVLYKMTENDDTLIGIYYLNKDESGFGSTTTRIDTDVNIKNIKEEYKNIIMNVLDCVAKCFIGLGLWVYYTKILV